MNIQSFLRHYGGSTFVSAILIAFVGWKLGPGAMVIAIILALLEMTFSFDNAVINARILERMSPGWQKAFIWVGIPIAVFGVRVFLPLLIVAAISGQAVGYVADIAINDSEKYGHLLDEAHYVIASFGGVFLLMLALDFFFKHKEIKWLRSAESIMIKAGSLEGLTVIFAIIAIFISTLLVDKKHDYEVVVAGLAGMFIYLILHSMNVLLARSRIAEKAQVAKKTFKAGLIGFLYLEVVDASFSLDSVIGAFAITKEIVIIAIGLGIGAIYVRSMTLHMLRTKALDNYRYMEHGAHYAIIILALLMIASLKYHIPEYITGTCGVVVIIASIWSSVHANKVDKKKIKAIK
jgi:uncharacterized protein